jgi:hypothetical protein
MQDTPWDHGLRVTAALLCSLALLRARVAENACCLGLPEDPPRTSTSALHWAAETLDQHEPRRLDEHSVLRG